MAITLPLNEYSNRKEGFSWMASVTIEIFFGNDLKCVTHRMIMNKTTEPWNVDNVFSIVG